MVSKEEFRLNIENRQLKKKLQKVMAEKEQLEQDYRELAEFAQQWARRRCKDCTAGAPGAVTGHSTATNALIVGTEPGVIGMMGMSSNNRR
jgi:hypothetical protein